MPGTDLRPPPAGEPSTIKIDHQAAASVASLEQAALWYATLRDEAASEMDSKAWRAWLGESQENMRAWQHIDAVSSKFDPLRGNRAGGVGAAVAGIEAARHPARNRRRLLNGLASVAALGMASWLGSRHTPLPQLVAALRSDHHTGLGERRELVLADGTRAWLNTETAIQVDYQSSLRRLVLLGGELLIDTAKDAQGRPFYVQTGLGRLEALGTRFTVRMAEARARLDVFEGAVEISTRAGAVQRIDAGQAAMFDDTTVRPAGAADSAREAWSKGRLQADDMPLGDLLAELARYRRGHISVAPGVADLKVMGVYPLDDTDRALAMLVRHLPIQVRSTLPWWTTVEAR